MARLLLLLLVAVTAAASAAVEPAGASCDGVRRRTIHVMLGLGPDLTD